MATTDLSKGVAALAREIATDQIAQDLDIADKLKAKANVASPAFTGTPTAPTAAEGTNTKQIATTAFVKTAVASKAVVADGVFAAFSKFNSTNGVK